MSYKVSFSTLTKRPAINPYSAVPTQQLLAMKHVLETGRASCSRTKRAHVSSSSLGNITIANLSTALQTRTIRISTNHTVTSAFLRLTGIANMLRWLVASARFRNDAPSMIDHFLPSLQSIRRCPLTSTPLLLHHSFDKTHPCHQTRHPDPQSFPHVPATPSLRSRETAKLRALLQWSVHDVGFIEVTHALQ